MSDPITGYPDSLLIDSTDLRDQPGLLFPEDAFTGLFAPGILRGSHDLIPGRRGRRGVARVLDSYQFSVPFRIRATDEDGETASSPVARRVQTIANYKALTVVCLGTNAAGLVALTRRLITGPGTSADEDADGAFEGVQNLAWPDLETVEGELVFTNLDGAWSPDAGTTWLVP